MGHRRSDVVSMIQFVPHAGEIDEMIPRRWVIALEGKRETFSRASNHFYGQRLSCALAISYQVLESEL